MKVDDGREKQREKGRVRASMKIAKMIIRPSGAEERSQLLVLVEM